MATPASRTKLSTKVLLLMVQIMGSVGTVQINKCCSQNEMLSKTGTSCEQANWEEIGYRQQVQPVTPDDYKWMHYWMPPGFDVDNIFISSNTFLEYFPVYFFPVPNVTVSLNRTDIKHTDFIESHLIFNGSKAVVPIEAFGASCIDAIKNRSTPFAVIINIGGISRCCRTERLRVLTSGEGKCLRGNSNMKEITIPYRGITFLPPVRYVLGDQRTKEIYQHKIRDFRFSTRQIICGDYEPLSNGTVRETFLIGEISQVTRGVYQLLRPLSFVCAVLLLMALAAILTGSRMRTTVHGWALASHAVCLLAFNLGQVAYFIGFSDDDHDFTSKELPKACHILGLTMYFSLTAAGSWLTAVCLNMFLGFRKLRVTRPGGGGNEMRRFIALSIFGWGVPTILTIATGFAFRNIPWPLTPSFMETRTCYHGRGKRSWYLIADKYQISKHGTAIFYYAPVSILVLTNIIFLGMTLQKVQFLRKGNSVLRSEEDTFKAELDERDDEKEETCRNPHISKNKGQRRRPSRVSSPGGHRITMYIKLLLMAGALEFAAEILVWILSPFIEDTSYFEHFVRSAHTESNKYAYRTAGYACDFFRAVCVAWLAAPDGGYWNSAFGWIQRWWQKKNARRCYSLGSRKGERKVKAK